MENRLSKAHMLQIVDQLENAWVENLAMKNLLIAYADGPPIPSWEETQSRIDLLIQQPRIYGCVRPQLDEIRKRIQEAPDYVAALEALLEVIQLPYPIQ